MRAFALDEFGAAGSVHDLPIPEPADGEVRIKVAAGGINPFDTVVLKGALKDRMQHDFPLIPCSDFAGTVDALGSGVDGWKVGDQAFGQLGKLSFGHGSLAEFTTASPATIARRPAAIDAQFGAALPLAGVSAWMCIEPMGLKNGDVVVILGAAGGIGGFAVQIAKHAGAHVVGVARGENTGYLRGLGADEVIDYTTKDVVETVRKAHLAGIAGLVHTAGDAAVVVGLAGLVREGGHVASMRGGANIDELTKSKVAGINVQTRVTTEALEKLAGMVEAGSLKRPEIKTYELNQAEEAFEKISSGHVRGKLVVIP